MYENEYEEYMRYVLGYPANNNTYINNSFPYRNNYDDLYPDIYNVLKPMVEKACSNRRSVQISEDLLEAMASEIYNNVESDITVVNLDVRAQEAEVNLPQNTNKGTTRNTTKAASSLQSQQNLQKSNQNGEDLTRACCANPLLKDLIKILLLNQLVNNNQNHPPRPPKPPVGPFPPRPPFGPYPPRQPYREMENYGYNEEY